QLPPNSNNRLSYNPQQPQQPYPNLPPHPHGPLPQPFNNNNNSNSQIQQPNPYQQVQPYQGYPGLNSNVNYVTTPVKKNPNNNNSNSLNDLRKLEEKHKLKQDLESLLDDLELGILKEPLSNYGIESCYDL